MAKFELSADTSSVTFTVTEISAGDDICIFLRSDPAGTTYAENERFTATGSTFTKTYYNLPSESKFAGNVQINLKGYLGAQYIWTEAEAAPSVEPWDWDSANGNNASAYLVRRAYNALVNKGPTTDFSYLVWNDMVQKVQEVCLSKGIYSWPSSAPLSGFGEVNASYYDKDITADRFNSLRACINNGSGIPWAYRGGTITGDHFITLMQKLNDWI